MHDSTNSAEFTWSTFLFFLGTLNPSYRTYSRFTSILCAKQCIICKILYHNWFKPMPVAPLSLKLLQAFKDPLDGLFSLYPGSALLPLFATWNRALQLLKHKEKWKDVFANCSLRHRETEIVAPPVYNINIYSENTCNNHLNTEYVSHFLTYLVLICSNQHISMIKRKEKLQSCLETYANVGVGDNWVIYAIIT